MRHVVMVIVALALAGCAAPRTGQLPLPPQPVAVEPRPGQPLPVARTHSEILIRTFVEDAGTLREVAGAACRLEAPTYTARVVSPGRVVVPVPRAGAPAIDVVCQAGEREGAARRGVVRDTGTAWDTRPWGWGPRYADPFYDPWFGYPSYRSRSGAWVGGPWAGYGGWGGWRRAAYYPDVEVVLR